jgi:hypothetical protein
MIKITLQVIIILICAFQKQYASAQTPQQNHLKYWYYRNRLVNDFMIGIGPDFGFSLPASERNESDLGEETHHTLKWGDSPAYLCNYIAVLASEYKLLSDNGENAEQTIRELYYAIYAFNRLDKYAEMHFGGTPDLNGFFVRDDISPAFLNMPNVISHLNQGRVTPVITTLSSDFIGDPADKEMSKDQVIQVVYGLALVIKLVPPSVTYTENNQLMYFQDGESSINIAAQNIVKRTINYMKVGDENSWEWELRNPVTGLPVSRGNDPWRESCAYAGAKFKLTGELTPGMNTASGEAACTLFSSFQEYVIPRDQDYKEIMLDAVANMWPYGVQADDSNNEFNALNLGPRSIDNGMNQYEIIPLIHQVLHGGNNYLMIVPGAEIPYYENLLNSAPCYGPYNYLNGNYPNYEWSTSGRFYHPDKRGALYVDNFGDYNGLDYMLLHNLFYLQHADIYPPCFNSMDGNVAQDFPHVAVGSGAAGFGSHPSPVTIGAFNTITAANTIMTDGDVTYRAGEEIILSPGFTAEEGSEFVAYIDPYDCSTGTFQRLARQQNEENNSPGSKNEIPVRVAPNPFDNSTTFIIDSSSSCILSLYDQLGREIRHIERAGARYELQRDGLSNGIYYYRVISEDGRTAKGKIVIQ